MLLRAILVLGKIYSKRRWHKNCSYANWWVHKLLVFSCSYNWAPNRFRWNFNSTEQSPYSRNSFYQMPFRVAVYSTSFGFGLMLRVSRIHVASFTYFSSLHILYVLCSCSLKHFIKTNNFLWFVYFILLICELFTATVAVTTTCRRHVDCKVSCNWSVEMANKHARRTKIQSHTMHEKNTRACSKWETKKKLH